MNHVDFVKNQNQTSSQKVPALTWIIASIMFHIFILLAIMTYKFNIFEQEDRKTIRPDDQVVLWTNQQQKIDLKNLHQPPAQETQQTKPEPKKEEKIADQPELPQKMPIIIPGKQGIDLQNLDGSQSPVQYPPEKSQDLQETATIEQEPSIENAQNIGSSIKNVPIYRTSPLDFPKGNFFASSVPKPQQLKQQLDESKEESKNMYKHVPKLTQKTPIKTISFKDIGLGQNNSLSTFGNSAHMGIQGDSPDIPTGEELKYITYLNQMANMIVSSMHANPQKNLVRGRTYEQVVFHVKVDRAGNLLATKIIRPSKQEVINIFIIESVKMVGLFNPLPNFISKDTFEINWRIEM